MDFFSTIGINQKSTTTTVPLFSTLTAPLPQNNNYCFYGNSLISPSSSYLTTTTNPTTTSCFNQFEQQQNNSTSFLLSPLIETPIEMGLNTINNGNFISLTTSSTVFPTTQQKNNINKTTTLKKKSTKMSINFVLFLKDLKKNLMTKFFVKNNYFPSKGKIKNYFPSFF